MRLNYYVRLTTLIPKSAWQCITHIFVTHGDPDHYWHAEEWRAISQPDVLMIAVAGKAVHNTMDEDESLEAVRIMNPVSVIPCNYSCPDFFTMNYNPANDSYFKREVEKMDSRCIILRNAESISL